MVIDVCLLRKFGVPSSGHWCHTTVQQGKTKSIPLYNCDALYTAKSLCFTVATATLWCEDPPDGGALSCIALLCIPLNIAFCENLPAAGGASWSSYEMCKWVMHHWPSAAVQCSLLTNPVTVAFSEDPPVAAGAFRCKNEWEGDEWCSFFGLVHLCELEPEECWV